ncbi:heterokaryon incompatibility protein-domain-containing protein [Boeremia exigua]|uniref:heterokaryon incompatibility protein-domain-containing protein n=1 Tax=Boeremia exigua TaxID=749465 RepID=UPI001E8ED0F3|nr:heterokaryon incompatibility protein-domain-containing protein [Boeremia exigua]KAH6644634.1 heterokaryon incompatibility protein-domain-containing protein [Boeremia exigua]
MQYTALDKSNYQIRLLHLSPSSDRRSIIACHFSVTSLLAGARNTNYEALSYAWGEPLLDRSINLEGTHFAVTANLLSILRALRYADQVRVLWIDAICIDQHNVLERSHQVSRMNDIYSRASNVIVWLGEPRSDAALAFSFLEEFGHNPSEHLTLHRTERNVEQTAMSVRSLLTRSWWTRIWTAQEWILAKSSIFQCGQHVLDGDVLFRCLDHFRRHVKSIDCCDMQLSSDFLFRIGDSLQPALALSLVKQSYAEQDFSYSLGFLRVRQATDPRDKVYGILALAAERYAGLLKANYNLPVEQVYEQIAIALIERTGRLDILSHVAPNQSRNLNVPTFVPDWTVELGKEYSSDWTERFRNLYRYNACLSKAADFEAKPGVLYIKGILTDSIVTMSPRRLGSYRKTRSYCNEILDDMYEIAEPVEDKPYDGRYQTRKEAFWLTMCGGYETNAIDRRSHISKRRLSSYQCFESWEEWFRGSRTTYQTSDYQLRSVTDSIASVSKGRTFCITEKGLMGWIPKNCLPGDCVAVMTGGRVPIILRPHDGYYTVLGDAYIHGIMDGEAIHAGDFKYLELR